MQNILSLHTDLRKAWKVFANELDKSKTICVAKLDNGKIKINKTNQTKKQREREREREREMIKTNPKNGKSKIYHHVYIWKTLNNICKAQSGKIFTIKKMK